MNTIHKDEELSDLKVKAKEMRLRIHSLERRIREVEGRTRSVPMVAVVVR